VPTRPQPIMKKFWLVARQEYRNRVFRRSFFLGTLVVPLLIFILLAAFIIVAVSTLDTRPIGYVDHSGVLDGAVMPERALNGEPMIIKVRPFPDEESADAALRSEEIQAYYVFPEDYLENPYLDLYYLQEPPDALIKQEFVAYLRYNLLPENPTPEQERLAKGVRLIVRSADGSKEFDTQGAGFMFIILSFGLMMAFLFIILNGSSYFVEVVADERANRTMELMITSVSPGQLIGGKSAGLLAVGLTQIVIWLGSLVTAWGIAGVYLPALWSVNIPWGMLLVIALFFVPTYAIVAGIMVAIGSVANTPQEAQQIAGVLNIFFTLPVFFASLAFANPDSPLMVALTLWPTTAMITIIMRWGLTVVPWWQIALGWLSSLGTAIFVVWAASRIFRVGMLRYGQRVSLRAAFGALLPK